MASEGTYTFSGVSHAILPTYGEGLLIGSHIPYTTQGSDEYKMTVDEEGFCIFHRMDGQPVAEGECYLKGDCPDDVIYVQKADAVTGIKLAKSTNNTGQWFDLQGRVAIKRGSGILIQGGRKFMLRQ